MKTKSPPCVVVGAGLPGIAASLALSKAGREVVILDSAPAIGGLLRSYDVDGYAFDYGTHFASYTGIEELDELLFGGFEQEWRDFPVLRAGNVCNGILNSSSDNPDLNSFGDDIHDRCLSEILSSTGWHGEEEPANSRDYLLAEYGPTLLETFFNPVFRKFTGKTAENLHRDASQLFHLKRFAVLDPSATVELKRSPRFDSKVSFHHREHFSGHKPSRYPRHGGIGRWIEQLEQKLEQAGVNICTGVSIQKILHSDGKIRSLVINGSQMNLECLLWGAAPAVFCNLAGLEPGGAKPAMRATVLAGLECNAPFSSDCHYLTVYDQNFTAFRITLYDNFREQKLGRHMATLEFMIDPSDIGSRQWSHVAEVEMRRLGLIPVNAEVVNRHEKAIPNGFPVQSDEAIRNLADQCSKVRSFSNVHLIGRASGEGWFLDSLIRGSYENAIKLLQK